MKKMIVILYLIVSSYNSYPATNKKIILLVPEYPPYTYIDKTGIFKGIGTEIVEKVLKNVGINYTLQSVSNHEKAFWEIKNGKADGVFLASQNNIRDEYCTFFPLISNNWSWFILTNSNLNPKDDNFKKVAKIGVMLNTNHQIWLQENKYNIVSTPKDTTAPSKILKLNRVDAFFMSEAVFWSGVNENEKQNFKSIKELEKPLGIYISNKFLNNNPDIIEKINVSIEKITFEYLM